MSDDPAVVLSPHANEQVPPLRLAALGSGRADGVLDSQAIASPVDAGGQTVIPPLPPPDPHDAAMDDVFYSAVEQAKAGNMHGAYIARLIWQDRRQRMPLDLPPLDGAAEIARAHVVVIAEAAAGRRTPQDALAYSRMFEYRRRSIEMLEIEPVLRKLNEANVEAMKKGRRGR